MATAIQLLKKYSETIKEEVNVKEINLLEDTWNVSIQYLPIGRELWANFGKDTWLIIWSAKSWNAKLTDIWTLIVSWPTGQTWELQDHQFEVRYSWFDAPNQVVEWWVMIQLDLETTQDLIDEWVAREISRFLNQMRKDADYDVSDRVSLIYTSDSEYLKKILEKYTAYLEKEALLFSVSETPIQSVDHKDIFIYDGETVDFGVKR